MASFGPGKESCIIFQGLSNPLRIDYRNLEMGRLIRLQSELTDDMYNLGDTCKVYAASSFASRVVKFQ